MTTGNKSVEGRRVILQLLQDFSIADPTGNSYEERIIADSVFGELTDKILALQSSRIKELEEALEKIVDSYPSVAIYGELCVALNNIREIASQALNQHTNQNK